MKISGGIARWLLLTLRARRRSWETLRADAMAAKARFDAVWSDLTEAAIMTPVRKAELASIGDVLVHLAVASNGTALLLNRIRQNDHASPPPDYSALFAGAKGRPLANIRREYETAFRRLTRALADESLADTPGTQSHFFFGPMTAREWAALVAVHFDYHTRQVRGFRRRLGPSLPERAL